MFERYTEKARRVIFFARYEASQYGGSRIETEHLLLGLVREDKALSRRLFTEPGALDVLRKEIARRSEGKEKTATSVDLPLSPESKKVLTYAAEEAERLAARHIGCEHIVLGMLREEQCFAAEVLRRAGITLEQLRKDMQKASETKPAEEKPEKEAARSGFVEAVERVRDLRDILGDASQYRAQGALWGAGYVRKCQSVIERKFHWERRPVKLRDAIVRRDGKGLMLYSGESYDSQEFELVKDGWKQDHCVVCWKMLYNTEKPEESFGYTNGADWLCQQCYEAFLTGG